MKVNLDGLRRNATGDLNRLGKALMGLIVDAAEHQQDVGSLVGLFNQVAYNQNVLNAIYIDGDNDFNELPETVWVDLIESGGTADD